MPASLRALAHPAALALAERHRGDACDNNLLQMEAELSCPREAVEGEEGELCLTLTLTLALTRTLALTLTPALTLTLALTLALT